MNDNRWLYFIVGGLLVVALIFFGVLYEGDSGGEGGGTADVESSAPASPAAEPSGGDGTAAGESSGASVTVEQKKE